LPGREVFWLARSSLFSTKFCHWLFSNMNCIPLDRKSGDVMAIRTALHLLKNGKCVMIYPEGTRSADSSIGEPLAGIGMLAYKTEVPVISCRIFGTFSKGQFQPAGTGWCSWVGGTSCTINEWVTSTMNCSTPARGSIWSSPPFLQRVNKVPDPPAISSCALFY
jgi:1-acyl-sn-glycerol-3-phosphate acyltransferase